MIDLTPNLNRLRIVFVILAIGCAVVAAFPDVALVPLRPTISHMRAPETAVPLVRGLFGIAGGRTTRF